MTVKVMMAYYYAHSTGVFTDTPIYGQASKRAVSWMNRQCLSFN